MTNANYNLFLDDFRYPQIAFAYMRDPRFYKLEWKIVRSYNEFVAAIEKYGIPQTVSYDHDLAEEHYDSTTWESESTEYKEKTGLDCTRYLIDKLEGGKHPDYIIHSMNPVGAERIKNTIQDYEKYRRQN